MGKAKPSGITPTQSDAAKILAMVARGDRRHDIAAWFGLNQGALRRSKTGSTARRQWLPLVNCRLRDRPV